MRKNVLEAIMKRDVYTVPETATVSDAVQLFVDKGISAAPIVNAVGEAVGFISDGDVMRSLSRRDRTFMDPIVMIMRTEADDHDFNEKLEALMGMNVRRDRRPRVHRRGHPCRFGRRLPRAGREPLEEGARDGRRPHRGHDQPLGHHPVLHEDVPGEPRLAEGAAAEWRANRAARERRGADVLRPHDVRAGAPCGLSRSAQAANLSQTLASEKARARFPQGGFGMLGPVIPKRRSPRMKKSWLIAAPVLALGVLGVCLVLQTPKLDESALACSSSDASTATAAAAGLPADAGTAHTGAAAAVAGAGPASLGAVASADTASDWDVLRRCCARSLGGRRGRSLGGHGLSRQRHVRHHGHQEHHGHAVLGEHALHQFGEVAEQGRTPV